MLIYQFFLPAIIKSIYPVYPVNAVTFPFFSDSDRRKFVKLSLNFLICELKDLNKQIFSKLKMDSSFKISHNFPDTLDSYKPPVNSENLYNHGVAENAMMTSDHSNITSSYLFIDDNEAPRAVVEDLDMNENSFLHISKNDIGDYENANVLQKYRSIDEDKSINSSVYSMNHSSNLIHHSKSFGQGQFPDWDNQRTMPSKGQSTFIIRDPNYLDGSDLSTYINRSCSDEVVTTVASAGLNCPGAVPVARSYQASRLTSQFASLQSGASSLEKTSTTSEGCLSSIEITQLSDDILSRIFSFCSWRDLLTVVSLVCKRWAFIIESDPYLCRFQNVQIDISSSNLGKQNRSFLNAFCSDHRKWVGTLYWGVF